MAESLVRVFITQEDMDAAYYVANPDGSKKFPPGNHRPFVQVEFGKEGWLITDWSPLKFIPGRMNVHGKSMEGILVTAPKGALQKI